MVCGKLIADRWPRIAAMPATSALIQIRCESIANQECCCRGNDKHGDYEDIADRTKRDDAGHCDHGSESVMKNTDRDSLGLCHGWIERAQCPLAVEQEQDCSVEATDARQFHNDQRHFSKGSWDHF